MNELINIDMSDFWNGDGGLNWMRFEKRLAKSLRPFGQHAILKAKISRDERILDVGCGWGDTSFELAKYAGSNGFVRGIDISDLILNQARSKNKKHELDNIKFDCVDAESHKFPEKEFDVIYSRFGVMFFKDPVAAFKNIKRALKPGGRLVFVCWQSVKANQWVNLPQQVAAKHVDSLEPLDPELPGGFSFGDTNRVSSILENAGFVDIKIEQFEQKFIVGENLDEAITFLSNIGPASSVIADPEINIDIRLKIINDLRNSLGRYKTSNGIALDAATWIITASN